MNNKIPVDTRFPVVNGAELDAIREEIAQGFLYIHRRANNNSAALLEVTALFHAVLGLLVDDGFINEKALEGKKEKAKAYWNDIFSKKEMGVVITRREKADGTPHVIAEIDCENRLHLCHAACCAIPFALTLEDVEKGKARWDLSHPYMNRQGEDGYCYHLNREKGCTIYEDRPFVCRVYDCREDKRIWKDFAAGVVSDELTKFIQESNKSEVKNEV